MSFECIINPEALNNKKDNIVFDSRGQKTVRDASLPAWPDSSIYAICKQQRIVVDNESVLLHSR